MSGSLPNDYSTSATAIVGYDEELAKKAAKAQQRRQKGDSTASKLMDAGKRLLPGKKDMGTEPQMNTVNADTMFDLHRRMLSLAEQREEGLRMAEKETRRLLNATVKTLDVLREELEAAVEALDESTRQSKMSVELIQSHLVDATHARQGTTYINWVLDSVKIGLGIFACFKLGQISGRIATPGQLPQQYPPQLTA